MESNNERRKPTKVGRVLLIIFLSLWACLCLSPLVAANLFLASHSICYKYNDWWIKGSSIEDVKEEYGMALLDKDEFSVSRNEDAVEVYHFRFDGYFSGLGPMDAGYQDLYMMEVDDKGIVIDVYYEKCRLCI